MNRREMFYERYSFLPRNPKGLKAKLLSKLDYLLGVDYYMKDFDNRRHYEEMGEGIGDFPDPDSALLGVGIPGWILCRLIVLLLSPILMPVHQIRVVIYDLLHRPSEDAPSVHVVIGDTVGDTEKDFVYWLVVMHEYDEKLKPLGFTRELEDKHDRDVLEGFLKCIDEYFAFISLAVPKLSREMEHCDYVPQHIRFMNVQKRPL